MVKTKKLLAFAGVVLLLFGTVGTVWALNASYNRPNPLMDYVPQELGIYDTMYPELNENSCRECHGNSLADRHHNSEIVIRDRLCTPCHSIIPDPPGVLVNRNCVVDAFAQGCHSWDNAKNGVNGWHHQTDWSASENCTVCHDPNLIAQISAFRSLSQYPPSVVTPTPFSCENCHWEQLATSNGTDPDDPFDSTTKEHPSHFKHRNIWGQFIGYYEYGKTIKGNYDTHHMGFQGNVASQCAKCHSMDPNNPDWDPNNPELIRYCEICHDIGTLHTIPPHVSDTTGWEATGFHVTGSPGDQPTVFRTFQADEQCFGCHADLIPDPPAVDVCSGYVPAITSISPNSGACYTYVTILGANFGEEHFEDSYVQVRLKPVAGNPWIDMPVYSWTETQIEFEVPCWTLTKGNYQVRVKTACGISNKVVFALKDWGTLLSISPTSGPCSTWLTLTGSGFTGQRLNAKTPPDTSIKRFVKVVASEGSFLLQQYKTGTLWTDTQIQARFYNMDRDDNADFISDGVIKKCDGSVSTWLGSWEVYFATVYWQDTNTNGDVDAGEVIEQVTYSDPELFELTADPVLFRLNPATVTSGGSAIPYRIRIVGQNFGPYQTTGEVHLGKKKDAKNPALGLGKIQTKIKLWSNTQIKVKVKVKPAWTGLTKYIWIEKDGKKSNFKKLHVN